MATRRAAVVGAGIGGLAAAAGLSRAGWEVTVFERTPALEPVGAGISLWPNALRALDFLGVGDRVRAEATLGAGTGVRRPDGRWLGRSDVAPALQARFGDPLVVLSRAELTDLLAGLLPDGALHTGTPVRQVVPARSSAAPRVVADDGEHEVDLVVAADGIGSRTREILFPTHPGPVYACYTTWRLIAPAPHGVTGSETWGPEGQRFAIVPMTRGRVYCYATANAPAGVRYHDDAAELRRRFGAWHEPIPQILAGLAPGQVLHHDVFELADALPSFCGGQVALLGDAAHAMTPELGQGGCLALEDAVTLAALVGAAGAHDRDLEKALAGYTALRLPRTTRLARRSRSAGRVTQASGPLATRWRDVTARAMAKVPPALLARGLRGVVDWRPP
jgi:2-polyprenyl-6-methoxyphenol hydroxylase-like FAD-dependent oxidoreductase